MLNFVIRKMLSKKWMVISLLIGNLLMIAIATASPMYSQAVLQRALMQDMNSYLVETSRYPGTFRVSCGYSTYRKISQNSLNNMEQALLGFDEEVGLSSLAEVKHYSVDARAVPQVLVEGEKTELTLKLSSYTDFADHIEIVHGELYSDELQNNTIDVVVSEKTFADQSLVLGKVLELKHLKDAAGTPYLVRIAGVFKNKDDQDPYWLTSPANWSNVMLMDADLFYDLFVIPERNNKSFDVEWHTVLDYTQMRADRAESLSEATMNYKKIFENLGAWRMSVYYQETLDEYLVEAQRLNTTILVLQVPIFMLLAAFIFMVSRQMLEIEQNEISVFKSRGAAKKQIILIYLIQSILTAALGIVGGIPLGILACKMIGASNDFLSFVQRAALKVEVGPTVWLLVGAAALFSIGTMVLPVIRYSGVTIVAYKQKKHRSRKRSWWKTICLDIVLLAVAFYGLFQFKGQEDYLVQRVMEGSSLDPMLYFCSSLFMLGCGLLFLRLLPWMIKLIFWAGKKIWPPAIYASFLRIIRANDNQGFLVVFLVLTISMGIFSTQMARTINTNSEERISYVTGADVVLQEEWDDNSLDLELDSSGLLQLAYDEPDFTKYQKMDEIESVTKVLVDKKASISLDSTKLKNITLMGINTKEFGQTAWFKKSLLSVHWYKYLNAMSQNSRAILVSSNLRDKHGFEVGDTLVYSNKEGDTARGIIYGFVDYWPSYSPTTRRLNDDGTFEESDNYLIVAHLSQLQSSWGITPYQVWIKTKGSSQFLYDFSAETGTKFVTFKDTAAELISLKNDPVFQGTNGILTIGFIIVLVLCTAGFLIYWILSIQSRTLQFGIYRAMGMSKWGVLSMLLNEQIFISGVSIGAGILVGRIGSELYVPLIQIAYSASEKVLPLEIVGEASDFMRLGIVIAAMLILCMAILGVLISKIRISQALKLGED